jgi:DNA-binding NarL/FixJ family response regulator
MPPGVLIVDDHQRFREVARRTLQDEGWNVIGEAADGGSALGRLEALDIGVVLLDVGLPDMNGLELAKVIRERNPAVAVVMVSTHDGAEYRQLALASGARGFLSKSGLTGAALAAVLDS